MDHESGQSSLQRKGKSRAIPNDASETTPLLAQSQQASVESVSHSLLQSGRRRLYIILSTVFVTSLCLCILIVLVIFFLALSYQSKISTVPPEELIKQSLVFEGPSRVSVLNVSEGSLWVQIDGKAGIDASAALNTVLYGHKEAEGGLQLSLGKWALRHVQRITANTSSIEIVSGERTLANITSPEITIPLKVDPPLDNSWLVPLSLPVRFSLTGNTSDLETFVKESWRSGVIDVRAKISQVYVHGGFREFRTWKFEVTRENIVMNLQKKIPNLPGLPQPGKGTPFPDFPDLVKLQSFNVTTENHNLNIAALASFINPLPEPYVMRIPDLSFIVYLANPNSSVNVVAVDGDTSQLPPNVPIAIGTTSAFDLTYKHPNTSVLLRAGPASLSKDATPILSSFVSTYLAGRDSPILIGTPLLPSLRVPAEFPAPNPPPRILQDVTIRDMRIVLRGERVLASGTVFARVILPAGIRLSLEAKRIWPDVLVFDGEVPKEDSEVTRSPFTSVNLQDSSLDQLLPRWLEKHSDESHSRGEEKEKERGKVPKEPLPDPLPERAFARIRPDDWLDAESTPLDADGGQGASEYTVTARVENVPLEVLPGREIVFQRFVAKVMFGSGGALAGVRGVAAVAASVDGIALGDEDEGTAHVVELTGLPFSGSFRVGKKDF